MRGTLKRANLPRNANLNRSRPVTGDTPRTFRDALDPGILRDLTSRGTRRHHPARRVIFAEGDPGSDLLVLETGQVEVSTVSFSGRKVVLGHLGPGDLLGEVALLDRSPRSATALAVSDVTGHAIGFGDFQAFLLGHPGVHFALTVEICAKLRKANRMLEDQTSKDGAARLARCILRLADKFGRPAAHGTEIAMHMSQADIGDLSGLTRSNVNRYLRTWSKQGIVAFTEGRLSVPDLDRLTAVATDA